MQQKILILAANPKGTTPLRLAEEVREIDAGLQRAKHRDLFVLEQKWAVRPRDIQRAMLDINSQIIHFSGHGTEDEGLVFEDETGSAKLVDGEALAGLFDLFADQVECIVLNGCYSEMQAEAISQHINYVIGMKKAIGDRAAIEFAVGFYDALGAGRSVEFAYKFGCAAIRLAGIPEQLTPTLKKKPNMGKTVAKISRSKDQPPVPHQSASESDQELNALADLLVISQKAKAREALCIKIGISYYNELGFVYESSEDSFAINLINYLNRVGNTKAICQLCCKELAPIFKEGKRESFLKEIAVKLNWNQEFRHNYSNPNTVEQPTSPTPSPVPEFRINSPNQPDGSKFQSKRLNWLTGGAIFLIGLAGLAGFQIYKTESVNPRYTQLENLLSEGRWQEADRETANRMWEVAGKWEERSLQAKDFENFSCEDLRTIDNLWTKYSKQHFGFSVQSRIFRSSDVKNDLTKFMSQIGWGKLDEKRTFWYVPIPDYSLSAPEGELPWIVTYKGSGDRKAYISRIINCGI